jgi:hypothetical protein
VCSWSISPVKAFIGAAIKRLRFNLVSPGKVGWRGLRSRSDGHEIAESMRGWQESVLIGVGSARTAPSM